MIWSIYPRREANIRFNNHKYEDLITSASVWQLRRLPIMRLASGAPSLVIIFNVDDSKVKGSARGHQPDADIQRHG